MASLTSRREKVKGQKAVVFLCEPCGTIKFFKLCTAAPIFTGKIYIGHLIFF